MKEPKDFLKEFDNNSTYVKISTVGEINFIKLIEQAQIEAYNEAIEDASHNLGLIETTSEEINNSDDADYSPWITADDGSIWKINKQLILNLKKNIENILVI